MDVQVLGPVEARIDAHAVAFTRPQQRIILGILAVENNHVVSAERLLRLVWGDAAPAGGRAVLQSRISEIRAALVKAGDVVSGNRIAARSGGYVLEIEPPAVDIERFRRLVSQARESTSEVARADLRAALALWRGPAFGGKVTPGLAQSICQSLDDARLSAQETLFDLELDAGQHRLVVDEIAELVVAHPSREHLTAQLMTALARTGRRAEALNVYRRARDWLAAELGIDTSAELQRLHLAILRDQPHALGPAVPTRTAPAVPAATAAAERSATAERRTSADAGVAEPLPAPFTAPVPQTLPPDVHDFTGRTTAVGAAIATLQADSSHTRVCAISGPAGIGKTTLAVRVAHELRSEFTDGQLFLDLAGIGTDQAVTPSAALGRFLRLLGVDSPPEALAERAELYRNLLAGRRVLVVLDNAADEQQVLPLLPSGTGCAVLVTSRARLGPSLSAHRLHLGLLEPAEAVALMGQIAGSDRVAAEPEAANQLVGLCGRLPLAVRIAAGRLAARPHWSIRHVAARLADEHQRLDRFTEGHLDVRTSISLSLAGLPADGRSLLCRLGNLDSPELTVRVAAALLNCDHDEAEDLLEELHDAQLITVAGTTDGHDRPRFRMHDLVRLFARERAASDEAPADLAAARRRAYGTWLSAVLAVHASLYGGDYLTVRSEAARWPSNEAAVAPFTGHPADWFTRERQSVMAIVRRAALDGETAHAWDIAVTAAPLYQMCRHFDELGTVLTLAHSAATAAGDLRGKAATAYRLGSLATDRLDFDAARAYFDAAATDFERLDDTGGQSLVTAQLGALHRFAGDPAQALAYYRKALPGLEAAGDHGAVAHVLRAMGQVHLDVDEYAAADEQLSAALVRCEQHGIRRVQAQARFWLGMLRQRQGAFSAAQQLFEQVLQDSRAIGDRAGEAQALRGIGRTRHEQGDLIGAQRTLTQALRLVMQPQPTMLEGHIRRELAAIADVRADRGRRAHREAEAAAESP